MMINRIVKFVGLLTLCMQTNNQDFYTKLWGKMDSNLINVALA